MATIILVLENDYQRGMANVKVFCDCDVDVAIECPTPPPNGQGHDKNAASRLACDRASFYWKYGGEPGRDDRRLRGVRQTRILPLHPADEGGGGPHRAEIPTMARSLRTWRYLGSWR